MTGNGLKDFGGGFLVLCLLAAIVFAYLTFAPFVTIFLLAAVLAALSRPLYKRLLDLCRGREALASFLNLLAVLIFVILPLVLLLALLVQESVSAYNWANRQFQQGVLEEKILPGILGLQEKYAPNLNLDIKEAAKSATGMAATVTNFIFKAAGSVLSAVTSTAWRMFLMLFALFYFQKDGAKIIAWIKHLIPLKSSLLQEVSDSFADVSRSAFYGVFLTALAQGLLGGIGFLVVGLPALVWGVVMAFLSMVPVVGTPLVWLPAALVLFVGGKIWQGVFLILWGALVVGMVDNLLRPYLMRGKAALHPSIMFFAILGGLSAFGVLGLLLGPLAVVILLAFVRAYEEAAKERLDELDAR
jgi:predicted PurR-regulated permease PerM